MKHPIDQLTELRWKIRLASYTLLFLLVGAGILLWFQRAPGTNVVQNEQRLETVQPPELTIQDEIINGIHSINGLADGPGYQEVLTNCTGCHSAQMVTQNRADRSRWEQIIRWMQETQGLWDLGEKEPIILDYLATYYPPESINRRANLDPEAISWYVLQ